MSTPAWLQTLGKLAPGIASAFGTPLLGMAVSAAESALGISGGDGTPDKLQTAIETGKLSGDQVVALKKADQDFSAKMKQLDIDLSKLQLEDVASARAREMAVKDSTPAILAFVMIIGFFAVTAAVIGFLFGWPDQVNKMPAPAWGLVGTMIGYLLNESKAATGYYFGTNAGNESSTSNEIVEELTRK
jgi:hypothetical protein